MKDACERLTPLGVMVLGLLREDDMHPYEMQRLLRQRRDDRIVTVTAGTLYHTVGRLLKAGLLVEVGVDRDGNRPERTTYALTDAGRQTVADWLRRELNRIDRPEQFRVALAESHNLPRAEVIELLRTRRLALAAEHQQYADGLRSARAKSVPEQYLLEIGRESALLGADLDWLDELLAQLERPDFEWGEASAAALSTDTADREAARR